MLSHCSARTLLIARAWVDSVGARCQTYLIFSKKKCAQGRASDLQTRRSTEEKAKQCNARQGKARHNKAKQSKAMQGTAMQDKPIQANARQGKASQAKAR